MGGGTLADVAVQVNLSRERIRQIEERLLPKLARRFEQEPDGRAVWGEWCALHGQRVMRGVEVRRADRPDDTLPFTET